MNVLGEWMSANAPAAEHIHVPARVPSNSDGHTICAGAPEPNRQIKPTKSAGRMFTQSEKIMEFCNRATRVFGLALIAATTAGCATNQQAQLAGANDAVRAQFEQRIKQKDSEIDSLKESLTEAQSSLATTTADAESKPGTAPLLPPNAKAGECYARVLVPPRYEATTEQMLKSAASTRIETNAARFETVTQQVLVQAASERLEVIPATYGWETEEILVKPATSKLVAVPARYETVTERVLVKPEHTVWKKGTGPITKVNEITGEIMCLVTVPAEYETVTKRVLVAEATTQEVPVAAEYKTIKRKVMTSPPTTRKIEIPAEYKTVSVRNVVSPAESRTVEIPATYQTVTSRKLVQDGYLEWRSILCETNMTREVITAMQSALQREGEYGGPLDGIVGPATVSAVNAYQRKQSLPSGGITLEMLKRLNVSI